MNIPNLLNYINTLSPGFNWGDYLSETLLKAEHYKRAGIAANETNKDGGSIQVIVTELFALTTIVAQEADRVHAVDRECWIRHHPILMMLSYSLSTITNANGILPDVWFEYTQNSIQFCSDLYIRFKAKEALDSVLPDPVETGLIDTPDMADEIES